MGITQFRRYVEPEAVVVLDLLVTETDYRHPSCHRAHTDRPQNTEHVVCTDKLGTASQSLLVQDIQTYTHKHSLESDNRLLINV